MRQIAVENAQMGMTLARAVYDTLGRLVLDGGTVLDTSHLPVLSRLEVKSLIVQDSRVDDVIIVPLVSEDVEAMAVRTVQGIMTGEYGSLPQHVKIDIRLLERVAKALLDGLYSAFIGDINLEGCLSIANYNFIHPVKTAILVAMLGKQVGFSRMDLSHLCKVALMQNIGYVLLPQGIMENTELQEQEKSADVRKHPELGYQILSAQKDLDHRVAEAVWHHHERWDGSGYPSGLRGDKISPFARVLAIADTYHALVSKRHGQQPFSPPEAAEFIVAYSGELFDPKLVEVFARNVPLYTKGVMVRLSSGEKGIVTDTNIGYIGRPTVRICYDRNGKAEAKPYDINLAHYDHQNKMIAEILDY